MHPTIDTIDYVPRIGNTNLTRSIRVSICIIATSLATVAVSAFFSLGKNVLQQRHCQFIEDTSAGSADLVQIQSTS